MIGYKEQFEAAVRVSVPVICIETTDQFATVQVLSDLIGEDTPAFSWDVLEGAVPVDDRAAYWDAFNSAPDPAQFTGPAGLSEFLDFMVRDLRRGESEPASVMCFVHNAHRVMMGQSTEPDVGIIQSILNARNRFRAWGHTLILMAPVFDLPLELRDSVIMLSETLPDRDQLRGIVQQIYLDASGAESKDETHLRQCVDALTGLSAFAAEQATAMSWDRETETVNLEFLQQRKIELINDTKGLQVFVPEGGFDTIGGMDAVKLALTRKLTGRRPPAVIVFIDEIEKAMGGKGDLTGISQDYHGQLLSFMQDSQSTGMIFLGPPGTAKSAVAKASGYDYDVIVVQLDLNGMKGSLVGESETNLRAALRILEAISDGNCFFVATCNGIAELAPELRRRFKAGTYYFDLPSTEEREAIWKIWLAQYPEVDGSERPNDAEWTGAEIQQCVELAYDFDCSLIEAAEYVVPIAKSDPRIPGLRDMADGKFLSANTPGVYQKPDTGPRAQRRIR
jgi:hypothetical protein